MTEIRLLLVDDNPHFVGSIKHMLKDEPDLKIVGSVGSGRDALDILSDCTPDVALVDTHLPDMHGFQLTEQIIEVDPSIQPIILSVASDEETILNAMRAGAKNFLQKPPTEDTLSKAIREAFQKKVVTAPLPPIIESIPEPKVGGKIVAIHSGKGGVGCTFLATNLALHLNGEADQAVLVDSDLQFGDIPVFLNLNAAYTMYELVDIPEELDKEAIDSTLLTHSSGMKVISSPHQPELADSISPDVMKRLLNNLKDRYPYVVVDMATDLNDVAVDIFDSADMIMLVMTPDIPSIKNMTSVMNVMKKLDIPTEKLHIIINMVGKKESLNAKQILDAIKVRPVTQLSYDEAGVARSINLGKPLIMENSANGIGQQLIQLGDEIKNRLDQVSEGD